MPSQNLAWNSVEPRESMKLLVETGHHYLEPFPQMADDYLQPPAALEQPDSKSRSTWIALSACHPQPDVYIQKSKSPGRPPYKASRAGFGEDPIMLDQCCLC